MLKAIALLLLWGAFLNALNMTITKGREKEQDFATLTLTHSTPFKCEQTKMPPQEITCIIDAIPKAGFTPVDTEFFSISYTMQERVFHLHIKPKFKEKLFAIPYDYKRHIPIQKLKPNMSKTWQIVGYHSKIPFLTPQNPLVASNQGINFPILIENAQTPLIQELDVDNKPLTYSKGQDLEEYLGVKQSIQQKEYLQALKAISRIFRVYPNTLFKKDLYLYEMIALSSLKKKQDLVIQIANQWLKFYPADSQVPHVLYMMGKAYSQINYDLQAVASFKRVIMEYPHDRYAALAQMHLAEQASNRGDKSAALAGFQKAYGQAKDIESASNIAFNWARFDLQDNGGKNTQLILDKVLEANPLFFAQNPAKSYETLLDLKAKGIFEPAIKIAQLLADQDDDPIIKEKAAFELGALYAKNNQPDEAHRANLEYLDNYDNAIHVSLVKNRDEEVLFSMHGNFDDKMARYDKILQEFPLGSKEHQKALDHKAKLLLSRKYYTQVLALAPDLKNNSPYMQEALLHLSRSALQSGDCPRFNTYAVQIHPLEPKNFDPPKQLSAFDCLYDAALYQQAAIFSNGALQHNTPDKLAWLYRQGRNLYALNNYPDSVLAAKDAFTLATLNKQEKYYDIAFTLFFDYMQTNNAPEAFKIYNKLQEHFKDDERMIEVYAFLLEYEGKSKNNPTTLEIYAKNLIALQKRYKNNSYTPYAQEQLISALIRGDKLQEALQESNALLDRKLDPKDRQRVLYSKATILRQENDLKGAQENFQSCLNIPLDSAWKDLCSQALNLSKP